MDEMAPGFVPNDMYAPRTRGLVSRLCALTAGNTGTMT
jgi:hypothetical protein